MYFTHRGSEPKKTVNGYNKCPSIYIVFNLRAKRTLTTITICYVQRINKFLRNCKRRRGRSPCWPMADHITDTISNTYRTFAWFLRRCRKMLASFKTISPTRWQDSIQKSADRRPRRPYNVKKTHTTKEQQGNASNRLLYFISYTAIGHHLRQQTWPTGWPPVWPMLSDYCPLTKNILDLIQIIVGPAYTLDRILRYII